MRYCDKVATWSSFLTIFFHVFCVILVFNLADI